MNKCSFFSHLDDSIRSDVLYFLLRVQRRGHLSSLAPLWWDRFSVSLSWSRVSKDTNNQEVDRKHDDWTLNANHHLLPGELDMTWREKDPRWVKTWLESHRSFGESAVPEFCEPLIVVLFFFNYCRIRKKAAFWINIAWFGVITTNIL